VRKRSCMCRWLAGESQDSLKQRKAFRSFSPEAEAPVAVALFAARNLKPGRGHAFWDLSRVHLVAHHVVPPGEGTHDDRDADVPRGQVQGRNGRFIPHIAGWGLLLPGLDLYFNGWDGLLHRRLSAKVARGTMRLSAPCALHRVVGAGCEQQKQCRGWNSPEASALRKI